MKEYLVIVKTVCGPDGFVVLEFDERKEAEEEFNRLNLDDNKNDEYVEYGGVERVWFGPNMIWTCPVCDGGPGNFCNCRCAE